MTRPSPGSAVRVLTRIWASGVGLACRRGFLEVSRGFRSLVAVCRRWCACPDPSCRRACGAHVSRCDVHRPYRPANDILRTVATCVEHHHDRHRDSDLACRGDHTRQTCRQTLTFVMGRHHHHDLPQGRTDSSGQTTAQLLTDDDVFLAALTRRTPQKHPPRNCTSTLPQRGHPLVTACANPPCQDNEIARTSSRRYQRPGASTRTYVRR